MTYTRGNIIIENIKVGDIHYEFYSGCYIKCIVISLPVSTEREDDIYWTWKSKHAISDKIIDYGVSSKYSHYGPNLYDYMAYPGCKEI